MDPSHRREIHVSGTDVQIQHAIGAQEGIQPCVREEGGHGARAATECAFHLHATDRKIEKAVYDPERIRPARDRRRHARHVDVPDAEIRYVHRPRERRRDGIQDEHRLQVDRRARHYRAGNGV